MSWPLEVPEPLEGARSCALGLAATENCYPSSVVLAYGERDAR